MTTYWTSTTTYPQAANGQVKAAKDLYGASSTQLHRDGERLEGRIGRDADRDLLHDPGGGGGGGTNLLRQPGLRVRRRLLDA